MNKQYLKWWWNLKVSAWDRKKSLSCQVCGWLRCEWSQFYRGMYRCTIHVQRERERERPYKIVSMELICGDTVYIHIYVYLYSYMYNCILSRYNIFYIRVLIHTHVLHDIDMDYTIHSYTVTVIYLYTCIIHCIHPAPLDGPTVVYVHSLPCMPM